MSDSKSDAAKQALEQASTALQTSETPSLSALDLILNAGPVVQLVMVFLVILSILCWAVVIQKWRLLKEIETLHTRFLELFWSGTSLDEIAKQIDQFEPSPLASAFKVGHIELRKLNWKPPVLPPNENKLKDSSTSIALLHHEITLSNIHNVERALSKGLAEGLDPIESHLAILSTTAASAPFIGLFGTVWGIMNSFQDIGMQGQVSLAVVAPGISEALIATAIGLAAAIPAVLFFNFFNRRIGQLEANAVRFCQDLINIIQRHVRSSERAHLQQNDLKTSEESETHTDS